MDWLSDVYIIMTRQQKAQFVLDARDNNDPRYEYLVIKLSLILGISTKHVVQLIRKLAQGQPL